MNQPLRLALAFAIGAVIAGVLTLMLVPRAGKGAAVAGATRAAAAVPSKKPAAPGEKREWPPMQFGAKSKAGLSTKPDDGTLMYRLFVTDLPPGGIEFGRDARLVVKLLDADGFALAELEVDPRENTKHLDEAGAVVSYEWLGGAAFPAEAYALVRSWNLSWSGITEVEEPLLTALGEAPAPAAVIPEPPGLPAGAQPVTVAVEPAAAVAPAPAETTPKVTPVPKRWQQKENWAKVKAGMSPQTVLLTIGVPTRRSTSLNMETWYYGDMETGGNVFFIAADDGQRVKSVTPPQK